MYLHLASIDYQKVQGVCFLSFSFLFYLPPLSFFFPQNNCPKSVYAPVALLVRDCLPDAITGSKYKFN